MALFRGEVFVYDDEHTVVDLFEMRAAERPEAPALLGEPTLTYGDVDRLANALAGRLVEEVPPGCLLPLVLHPGPEVVVSVVAAMKAAIPFVPLDASWPAARLASMVAATGAASAVCSPGASAQGAYPVTVDLGAPTCASGARPRTRARLDDLIYGYFTSGSTGQPKCALNVHRGLRNRVRYMTRRFGGDHVVLQNSPHTFDSCMWQILWPLSAGMPVAQRPAGLDLEALVDVVERHAVTITDFVPSVLHVLVELLGSRPCLARRLGSLRHVLVGGEAMDLADVRALRRALPGVAVTNTYGPTEASIGMMFHAVTDADAEATVAPIGLPIDNTCAAVLDDFMTPVGGGEIGDLYIGGECLGAGYFEDVARTKEAFVENPLPELGTAVLYRTGDQAYVGRDGLLYFAGRNDDQVKLAGTRVELGEVEAALRQVDGVRMARVLPVGDRVGGRLVAFVTCRPAMRADDVATGVRALLPGPLVPSQVIVVDEFPLLPSGKLDRASLRRLAGTPAERATGAVPWGPTASAVAAVWAELLPAPPGPDDDFFACGGDSLLAQRAATLLNQRLGTALTVRSVIERPTVEAMAAAIDSPTAVAPTENDACRADATLADALRPLARAPGPPARVLLTGATGFVGAQLLHALAKVSAAVYCLVRADDDSHARARLAAALERYGLADGIDLSRVVAVPGDLAEPGLGLSRRSRARLAETADAIVHNGAMVNLVLDYHAHRGTNVLGTLEILRLAVEGRPKRVHHISTVAAVGDRKFANVPIAEQAPAEDRALPAGGYARSKWVAERLAASAMRACIPVTVYRLAEVVPSSITGIPNGRAIPELLVNGCIRTGLRFRSDIAMDYTPVDFVAAAVVAGVRVEAEGWFNVVHPTPIAFDDLLDTIEHRFELRTVTYPTFWSAVRDAAEGDPDDRDLARLMVLLPRPAGASGLGDGALSRLLPDNTRRCSTDRLARLMTSAQMVWPSVDARVVGAHADYYGRSRPGALAR